MNADVDRKVLKIGLRRPYTQNAVYVTRTRHEFLKHLPDKRWLSVCLELSKRK